MASDSQTKGKGMRKLDTEPTATGPKPSRQMASMKPLHESPFGGPPKNKGAPIAGTPINPGARTIDPGTRATEVRAAEVHATEVHAAEARATEELPPHAAQTLTPPATGATTDPPTGPPATNALATKADGFARSKIMARTPPQAATLPASGCAAGKHKLLDFTESENDESDMDENPGNSNKTYSCKAQEGELGIIQALRQARDKLSKQKTSGQCLTIKTEVIADLDNIIDGMLKVPHNCNPSASEPKDPASTDRIAAMESDLQEIKTVLKSMHPTMNKKKTWAQVAAEGGVAGQERSLERTKRERLEKHRIEKAKTEVVITTHNASEKVKKQLADLNEEGMTKDMQDIVKQVGLEPSLIYAVRKSPNQGLRIQCPSENDVEKLCKLD